VRPLSDVCAEIAAERATNTINAIHRQRAAQLATDLESYSRALSELAEELARDQVIGSEKGDN